MEHTKDDFFGAVLGGFCGLGIGLTIIIILFACGVIKEEEVPPEIITKTDTVYVDKTDTIYVNTEAKEKNWVLQSSDTSISVLSGHTPTMAIWNRYKEE